MFSRRDYDKGGKTRNKIYLAHNADLPEAMHCPVYRGKIALAVQFFSQLRQWDWRFLIHKAAQNHAPPTCKNDFVFSQAIQSPFVSFGWQANEWRFKFAMRDNKFTTPGMSLS